MPGKAVRRIPPPSHPAGKATCTFPGSRRPAMTPEPAGHDRARLSGFPVHHVPEPPAGPERHRPRRWNGDARAGPGIAGCMRRARTYAERPEPRKPHRLAPRQSLSDRCERGPHRRIRFLQGRPRPSGHLPAQFRSGHSMSPSCLFRHQRAVSLYAIPYSGSLSFAVEGFNAHVEAGRGRRAEPPAERIVLPTSGEADPDPRRAGEAVPEHRQAMAQFRVEPSDGTAVVRRPGRSPDAAVPSDCLTVTSRPRSQDRSRSHSSDPKMSRSAKPLASCTRRPCAFRSTVKPGAGSSHSMPLPISTPMPVSASPPSWRSPTSKAGLGCAPQSVASTREASRPNRNRLASASTAARSSASSEAVRTKSASVSSESRNPSPPGVAACTRGWSPEARAWPCAIEIATHDHRSCSPMPENPPPDSGPSDVPNPIRYITSMHFTMRQMH